VNVTTAGFPASASGDSDIDAQLALPSPCVAPVVFILAGSEDKWFAVTGFEASDSAPPHGGGDDDGGDGGHALAWPRRGPMRRLPARAPWLERPLRAVPSWMAFHPD